jgi:molybdopterin molybdotransferase
MPWAQAYWTARTTPRPLPVEDTVAADAIGRVLAAPLHATSPIPAFDTAAMDGYAVAGPGPWTVTGRLLAGPAGTPEPLCPGTAVEIATGAPVPAGTDAVLPYEDSHRDGSAVTGSVGVRIHIRRAGADLHTGAEIVSAGRRVTATLAAAAVQAGVELLPTRRPPVVTLLVTGDEVITSGVPGPGQVRDSFTGLIGTVTARAGGRLHTSRHVPDDPSLLRAALDSAQGEVIAVSGASSAGAADHLHRVLTAAHATWHIRGVACRPGHPQGLAALPDGRWVVSLPGNPYAGLVAALTLLEPLLHALARQPSEPPPQAAVHGVAELMPDGARIVPVQHYGAGWRTTARTGSASLHAAAAADALAVLPADWISGAIATILSLP